MAPALRAQVDRALRLQRRDVVKVNAAALLIATRMLRFYWALYDQVGEARPNPRAVALAFSRAWYQGAEEVAKYGYGDLMPRDSWRNSGNVDWVTRELADDLLLELETCRRSQLGDGRQVTIDARWVDWTICLLHAMEWIVGGIAPQLAVTNALASFAGRQMPDQKPLVDNASVCASVRDILSRTDSAARTLLAKAAV